MTGPGRPARDGRLIVVAGKSRSGKTSAALELVTRARSRLVVVWDRKGEWSRVLGAPPLYVLGDLRDAMKACQLQTAPSGVLCYVPGVAAADDFVTWAGCCLAWSEVRQRAGLRATLTVVAEELPDVTPSGRAPGEWGTLLRLGLGYGVDIIAITQAPAESDKTTIRNASEWRVFQLGRAKDRDYVAAETGVDRATIDALTPHRFIRVDLDTGRASKGTSRPISLKGTPRL